MAVFAPMPRAMITIATNVNPGLLSSSRRAYFRFFSSIGICLHQRRRCISHSNPDGWKRRAFSGKDGWADQAGVQCRKQVFANGHPQWLNRVRQTAKKKRTERESNAIFGKVIGL